MFNVYKETHDNWTIWRSRKQLISRTKSVLEKAPILPTNSPNLGFIMYTTNLPHSMRIKEVYRTVRVQIHQTIRASYTVKTLTNFCQWEQTLMQKALRKFKEKELKNVRGDCYLKLRCKWILRSVRTSMKWPQPFALHTFLQLNSYRKRNPNVLNLMSRPT